MTARTFNSEMFAELVRAPGGAYATMAAAAIAAGVSKAQFFRAIHGQPVNNAAFLSLCVWAGADPLDFLTPSRGTTTETRRPTGIRSAA